MAHASNATTVSAGVTLMNVKGSWGDTPNRKLRTIREPASAIAIPAAKGSGEYYLEKWSFRRAGSRISTEEWVEKGKGNRVKY